MENVLRVAVLGLTHDHVWGNLAALRACEGAVLVAVADPHAELSARAAGDKSVAVYTDARALLEREAVDAVLVYSDNRESAELAALAARKGVSLPQEPNELQQQLLGHLAQQSGGKFDCAYMSVQVVAHLQTIALFKTEATFGADKDVRAFAVRWLPGLKLHLRDAVRLLHRLDC